MPFKNSKGKNCLDKVNVDRSKIGNLFYQEVGLSDPTQEEITLYLMTDCTILEKEPKLDDSRIKRWKEIESIWN